MSSGHDIHPIMAVAGQAQLSPLAMHLPAAGPSATPDIPPISALFLIVFDVKAGYTIVWKQAVQGLELEGVVEYKSLPSGLHSVKEDLIYFVHDAGHAGLSAFANVPCDEEDARHARMIAVGVLVPLSFGRLGRAWRHAEALKNMAAKLAIDHKQTGLLDAYWEHHMLGSAPEPAVSGVETPIASPTVQRPSLHVPKGHTRNRSSSDAAMMFLPGHTLSQYHPARSLTALLDTFGPLVFPLHRAALLRKRILISCHAPVHETCNFVYDLSVLSNVPQAVADFLPDEAPTQRLRPIFTIGVHDITALMQEQTRRDADDGATLKDGASGGWIACTTDSILAMKETLWDVLVTMPPPFSSSAAGKVWPTVECPGGQPIKATQRDLRRFRALRTGLARIAASSERSDSLRSTGSQSTADIRPSTSCSVVVDDGIGEALDTTVQPPSWAELAYGGFMWWASAGEQRYGCEHDEAVHDASLIADWAPAMPVSPHPHPARERMVDSVCCASGKWTGSTPVDDARVELAIVAFFHRLTTDILTTIRDAVDADQGCYEDEDEEFEADSGEVRLLPPRSGTGRPVRVDSAALELMGLDVWSAADMEFVKMVAEVYFGRGADIEGKGIEVCGLRVC